MSLKNIVSFGEYTPPPPASFKITELDVVNDFTMSNGDTIRYLIRKSLKQFDMTFNLNKEQFQTLKSIVQTGEEIQLVYNSETFIVLLMSFNYTVNNVRQKGNYTVNLTLKESRR